MENVVDNLQSQSMRLYETMTRDDIVSIRHYMRIISRRSNDFNEFANLIKANPDLLVKIMKDREGSSRVQKILGISEPLNRIIFYAMTARFTENMTHIHSYSFALRILKFCNVHQAKIFCHLTLANTLVLANDVYGCTILKWVITTAEDSFKGDFLDLIAKNALLLSEDGLGRSLIQHVLKLHFTYKTTHEYTRLHEVMAEFDDTLSSSNISIASKLASDSDLFIEFIKTMRGSLMVHVILGMSEEVDMIFLEAIEKRFTDVHNDKFGYLIMLRIINLFKKRGSNYERRVALLAKLAERYKPCLDRLRRSQGENIASIIDSVSVKDPIA